MKKCSRCEVQKSLDSFSKCKSNKNGLHSWCRLCVKNHRLENKDKYNLNKKRDRQSNPIKSKEGRWKNSGIINSDGSKFTWHDYQNLLTYAGNKCEICGVDKPGHKNNNWCVDHIHNENGVGPARGILCHDCNLMLGQYEKALKYEMLLSYLKRKF